MPRRSHASLHTPQPPQPLAPPPHAARAVAAAATGTAIARHVRLCQRPSLSANAQAAAQAVVSHAPQRVHRDLIVPLAVPQRQRVVVEAQRQHGAADVLAVRHRLADEGEDEVLPQGVGDPLAHFEGDLAASSVCLVLPHGLDAVAEQHNVHRAADAVGAQHVTAEPKRGVWQARERGKWRVVVTLANCISRRRRHLPRAHL